MFRLISAAGLAIALTVTATVGGAQSSGSPGGIERSVEPPGVLGTRTRLGYARYATNDLFGDGKDRWRTGSLSSSRVWGYGWDGQLPYRFGDVIELRLTGQIMQPSNLSRVDPNDRRWAGAISVGVYTHFRARQTELSLGGEMVFVGPQTQLDHFQTWLHQTLNIRSPNDAIFANQIGNKIRPTLAGEAGRSFIWGDSARFRPFLSARLGDESFLRAGGDLTIGVMGLNEFLVRDPVSGHRVRTIKNDMRGLSFVIGGDLAYMFDSVYLPGGTGPGLRDTRERARLGLQWQNRGTGLFYGLTYLGEEFQGQSDGQVIGAVKLDIRW